MKASKIHDNEQLEMNLSCLEVNSNGLIKSRYNNYNMCTNEFRLGGFLEVHKIKSALTPLWSPHVKTKDIVALQILHNALIKL